MHTTPAGPIDVPSEFPAVVPFARTTVRLHPRAGAPTAGQSSVGGPLLWPAGEPWPVCDGPEPDDHYPDGPGEPAAPLVPVLQLFAEDIPELPFPEGTDVLQVLWCPFDHEPFDAPRPEVRWRRRAGLDVSASPAPDVESDPRRVPRPCVIAPERVVEYPSHDLPPSVWSEIQEAAQRVERDTGWSYERDLAVASGIKVGGYPGWTQSPDWPACACGATMDHLLTIASWEFDRGDERRWIPVEDRPAMAGWGWDAADDHPWRGLQNPTGLMLGDAGGIYLFVCPRCPAHPTDYRFDCG
ncbi:hypothetical protein BJY16_008509 [Actinoplanes octamycinicus]|uniref:DUF1963 domain-containing protein n=1 Tax=Actinoplanes octamycinicus TaxID=135948 RepID=A0A7W7MCQ1_9ACTN|nr:hypothetical protein [Actinoplanes octamycinicus]MBB4745050.1 hypothetical protein [Actinoplanes octamycinicus]GIE55636.1 hypothetical protein Aoc01nite_10380 [Actinoplanes octamycinicus]